jgi:hypothetical protein
MKKIHLLIIVAFGLFTAGCETDVELNDTYTNNSYVFGLLDQNADTQFVRVNRAFLGSISADEMAKYSDSINYKSGDIKVEIIDENNTILLNPIVKSKADGYFNNSDHIVYYTTTPIVFTSESKLFGLKVSNNRTGEVITGETELIENVYLYEPNPSFDVTFIRNCPTEGYCFGTNFNIEWGSSANAVKYEVILRFVYNELDIRTNDTTYGKYYDYPAGSVSNNRASSNVKLKTTVSPELFYTQLGKVIPTLSDNIVRFKPRVEVLITAAHEDLSLYIDATKPTNDINQNKSSYSNLSNGIGIFSSRVSRNAIRDNNDNSKQLPFNSQSIQKLIESDLTKHLNFRPN